MVLTNLIQINIFLTNLIQINKFLTNIVQINMFSYKLHPNKHVSYKSHPSKHVSYNYHAKTHGSYNYHANGTRFLTNPVFLTNLIQINMFLTNLTQINTFLTNLMQINTFLTNLMQINACIWDFSDNNYNLHWITMWTHPIIMMADCVYKQAIHCSPDFFQTWMVGHSITSFTNTQKLNTSRRESHDLQMECFVELRRPIVSLRRRRVFAFLVAQMWTNQIDFDVRPKHVRRLPLQIVCSDDCRRKVDRLVSFSS